MNHICNFVPSTIIQKLPTASEADKELDDFFHKIRQYLVTHPKERKQQQKKYQELMAVGAAKARRKILHLETRRLYDSQNKYVHTDTPIAVEEQIHSAKPSANKAMQFTNIAYDFFHNKCKLESFDNKSTPIDVSINFGNKYNNAFWDGKRLSFGNGDGTYFNSFLLQSVLTHELAHAVTEYQSGLSYEGQAGALNEHLSDVFAVCVDQQQLKQKPTEASWVIGEGLFTSRIKGKGIRTFKNELAYDDPVIGKDPQPKFMKNYKNLPNDEDHDYGGVHVNSGILNHFFYNFCILAETEVGDETINHSYKAPMQVIFNTYPRIKPNNTFKEYALDTISVCKRTNPQLLNQIKKAWKIVGLYSYS